MRRDLRMRRGKEIAQGAHAAMAFLREHGPFHDEKIALENTWFETGHTKVCVRVDSEQALQDIYDIAKIANLEVHMIIDEGNTEFHGVKTKTCLAIGPNKAEDIDRITGHLQLY